MNAIFKLPPIRRGLTKFVPHKFIGECLAERERAFLPHYPLGDGGPFRVVR